MKLIGMLDSPYVRRVAVSLQMLGLPFEHESVSVFRHFDRFHAINPVVKAPTLICDDGSTLMDSSLILDYAEALATQQPGATRSLMPVKVAARQECLRRLGLALAACEKAVQVIYERNLRPADKQYLPWIERVTGQMLAAWDALETTVATFTPEQAELDQAGITIAIAWHFTQQNVADLVPAVRYPHVQALSARAEALPEFRAAPHGDGVYRAGL